MTDEQGAFRLNVSKGGRAVFWLLPKDYAPSSHPVDEKRGDMGRFTLEKGIVVKGRVVDEQGKPVVGAWVNVEVVGGPAKKEITIPVVDALVRSALTDEKGEYTLTPLPPGECLIRVAEYPREALLGRQPHRPLSCVFTPKELMLKAEGAIEPVELRAVPQVVIEGQFYDSKGKPCMGPPPALWGHINAEQRPNEEQSWLETLAKLWGGDGNKRRNGLSKHFSSGGATDHNGRFIVRAPKGLNKAKLMLMVNEHGALRFRMAKDGPLSNQCRDIELGKLDGDVRGIEVILYQAPILFVKPIAEDGRLLRDATVQITYAEGRRP